MVFKYGMFFYGLGTIIIFSGKKPLLSQMVSCQNCKSLLKKQIVTMLPPGLMAAVMSKLNDQINNVTNNV